MREEKEVKQELAEIRRYVNDTSHKVARLEEDMKWVKKLLYLILCAVVLSQGINVVKGAVVHQSKVIEDVQMCPYNTSEYVRGVFDCSNMAKMLYDFLTERGHHCVVVYVENFTYGIKHNFLFVDGYAVEPTTKDFAWWYYQGWYGIDKLIYVKPKWLYGKEWEYPRRW